MAGLVPNEEERMRQNAREFKQQVGGMVAPVANAVGQVARSVVNAGLIVPRTIKGVVTGEIPVTVSARLPQFPAQRAADDRAQALARKQAEADANPMATPSPLPQQGMPRLGIKPRMDQVLTDAAQRMRPQSPDLGAPAGTPAVAGPAIDLRATPASTDTPAAEQPAQQEAQQAAAQGNGWTRTGINGVVGRMDGDTPSFTNDPEAVKGAGMRAPIGGIDYGARGITTVNMREGTEALARANAIRGQQPGFGLRQAMQSRNLVMAGIRAGLRSNSADERLAARRELAAMQKSDETGAELVKAQMDAAYRGADIGLRERELASNEQARALTRQRTEQELEMGDLELSQARRRDALLQQLGNPDLPQEQRGSIMQQLQGLSGKSTEAMTPRDYIIKQRVPMIDPITQMIIGTQEVLIDGRTGQPFGQPFGQQGQQGQPRTPKVGDQVGGYRFKGGNPADQNNWEAI